MNTRKPLHKRSSYISILIHIFAWLMFSSLLFLFIPLSWHVTLPYQFWLKQTIVLCLLITVYYLNANLIVPRLLFNNKSVWYSLVIVTTIILSLWIIRITDMNMEFHPELRKSLSGEFRPPPPSYRNRMIDPIIFMMVLLILGISTSITAIRRWQGEQAKQQLLEKEKVKSELSFLKAQINPHLFFNTLNAIYALTHIDVETSRTALHKLSRIMRYVLYETDQEQTLLHKEIEFINDYIELMKLRVIDKADISFETPETIDDIPIAPMLLLPFIENAFKHGINPARGGYIKIKLAVIEKGITFTVVNTLYPQQDVLPEKGSGIGIGNARRRLNLLYPAKHTLVIKEYPAKQEYSVILTLDVT